jgi:AbiV family abortive infection protein
VDLQLSLNRIGPTNQKITDSTMDKWRQAATAALENGEHLLGDADWLCTSDRPGSTFALAVIAQEEFAKAFLFYLISQGILPANALVLRIARDHACKQLLGLVMEYMNPDIDVFLRRMDEWEKQRREQSALLEALGKTDNNDERREICEQIDRLSRSMRAFPANVADAMNILRFEKVGRWADKNWVWGVEPEYDPMTKNVGDGSTDRDKQDGLYVRVARDGTVVTTPECVRPEVAQEAFERARRFGYLARQLLKGDFRSLTHYDRVKETISALFADLRAAE